MTDAERAVPDREQRALALDPARSFIVQAPAGSGKTTLLVNRFLALLDTVREPEEIVAITFTRKAAAEMRERVLQRIAPELAPRLRIQTIDALCAALTAQLPVLARFGAQPAIAEDAAGLYREAAERTLADITAPVARLLEHLDNSVADAAAMLAEMLARRDQWLRQAGAPPARAQLEAALVAERERLVARAGALHPGATPELAAAVLTKKGDWRKRPAAPPELQVIAGLREALAALLAAPPAAYTESQWEALAAILALLRPALAQLRLLFAERGEVDFTEIAHGALAALGAPEEPTDLLLALDVRVKHLLVDEFQDTSNSQWELLERLTAGWEEGDGRTLFAVGDPMQSIYSFRDAQVGLFLRAWRAGLPAVKLHPLTLATNFRSQGAIVDWVNRVFARILPGRQDETSGAVPYSPSAPSKEADLEGAPALELFADRETEARRVIELVRAARGRTAVLVRNRSHLDAIVPALEAAGIAFRAVEIEPLGEKQVVQDLYALTRALVHPGDRVAWLAVLRAPWCGLTLAELSALFESRPERTIWESIQGVPRLVRLVSVFAPALENRLRGTLRDRVEGTWLALGGPACLAERTGLEDAGVFLDELERLEQAGELADPDSLADSLARLFAEPDVAVGPEALEIMTIHKAKGLEFDTVIVPGLDREPRAGRKPLFAWRALAGGKLLLAPIDATGEGRETLYEYVRALEREAGEIEAGRLLYVAATRARSRLHLLGRVEVDADGTIVMPSRRSLLGLAWDALRDQVRLPAAKVASAQAGARPPAQGLSRLSPAFRIPEPPAPVKWQAAPQAAPEEGPPFDWAQEAVRHAGIVVHAWLQRIAEDALRGWDAQRVALLRARIVRDLARRGVAPADLERAAQLVVAALGNALEDERGRWLLGAHPVARSEYRLHTREHSLRIDRYIEDARGTRWVVDYKTSAHAGGGLEAFLDEQRARYAPQLDRYADAVGGARRGLYFPLHKGWREW